MSMAPKPKTTFGKPEKQDIRKTILLWGFVAVGVIGIVWMVAASPREKALNCSSSTPSSLIGFGSCTTE